MSTFYYIRSMFKLATFTGVLLVFSISTASAGNPYAAYYSSDNNKIFWLIQITDIHIGASGSDDSNSLRWVVTEGMNVVNPKFIVATGDLTDSSDGAFIPGDGPYIEEWNEYKAILTEGNIDCTNYFDIPGNHDAYNDQFYSYYLANSVQGQATGNTQVSWTYEPGYGKYHFLGTNTVGNDGADFSLFDFSGHFGDYAGLDESELTFINDQLYQHSNADLTLVFGHHPLAEWGGWTDTYLYYGAPEFIGLMDSWGASLYGYGHTHLYSEVLFQGNSDTGYMLGDGIVYLNVDTLGKPEGVARNNFSIIAIDCNGISIKTQPIGTWPVVLITAPIDRLLGSAPNPYAYSVPNGSANPIRALVFDSAAVAQVQYRIDGTGDWNEMTSVIDNPHLWEGVWDASMLPGGLHTIEVQASTGSGTRTELITVDVEGCSTDADCNDGLYCNGTEICVDGSCLDGNPVVCSDGVECTDDFCDEGNDICYSVPNDANCDDGLYCNGEETCDQYSGCQSGTPVTCNDDGYYCTGYEFCDEGNDICSSTGNPCTEGICNEETDQCESSLSCGNGICEEGEDCHSCASDCISGEGGGICEDCHKGRCDGVCSPKDGPNCADCVTTSTWCCGDGKCEEDESKCNCAIDCGEPPLSEAGSCTDGLDNDCDDFTDCDDDDCINDPSCQDCSSCFKGVCDGNCNPSKEGPECPDCQ